MFILEEQTPVSTKEFLADYDHAACKTVLNQNAARGWKETQHHQNGARGSSPGIPNGG